MVLQTGLLTAYTPVRSRVSGEWINGFDPSVMEDQSAYFDDLGISNRLHRKRFGRAIRILLLSIAEVPSKPAIRCWEGDTTKDGMSYIHIVWSPKFMCEADKGETSLCIPVHKWRLHRRTSNFDAWEFVGEFAPDQRQYRDLLRTEAVANVQYRLDSWNFVGKSSATSACKPRSTSTAGIASTGGIVSSKNFEGLFTGADTDGDGHIEAGELRAYYESAFGGEFVHENAIRDAVKTR